MVRAFGTALFVQLLGRITLFVGFGLPQRLGARLRGAANVHEARTWLTLGRSSRPMFPAGLVMLFASGMHLASEAWSLAVTWVAVSLVALAGVLGPGIGVAHRHFTALDAAARAAPEGPLPAALAARVRARVPAAALGAANGAAIDIVWLMATKPMLGGSVGALALTSLAGAAIGAWAARRA